MTENSLKTIINRHKKYLIFLFLTWGIFFTYVFSKMISFKKDGLYLGHPNVWSDWALHIGIANLFAYKNLSTWFSYHPIFSEGKFTYPFLPDLISGLFIRIGFPLSWAFFIPSVIASIILVFSMYCLFYIVSGSRVKSVVAIQIFFLSAGLGFFSFGSDFLSSPNIDLFIHPIKEYGRLENYQWLSGNVIVGLFISQRGFLMGMAIGLTSLTGFIYPLLRKNISTGNKRKILIFSGLLAGSLPIIHPHSFIVLIVIEGIIALANLKQIKNILYHVVPAATISSILTSIFIVNGIQNSSFISFLPGWTSKGIWDFLYMWLNFWGIAIPLAVFVFIFKFKEWGLTNRSFFLSFFLIFILGNTFLFQPIVWDNSKLFWWSYLGISLLCSIGVVEIFRHKLFFKLLAICFFIILTFTGFLELSKLLNFDRNTFLISSWDDIKLGEEIRNSTDSSDIFATGTTHNNLVMVWGVRPIILGYTAWTLNFGFDYQQGEKDLYAIYKGGEQSKTLIEKYSIRYLLIGPSEISQFQPNEEYFIREYPLAFSNSTNKIYRIR